MKKIGSWLKGRFNRSSSPGEGGEQPKTPETDAVRKKANELQYTTGLSTPQLTLRQTIAAAWQLSKPYFFESPDKHWAKSMVAGIAAVTLGQVGLATWLNHWRGGFWDSMATLDANAFMWSLGEFGVVAGLWVGASVYRDYLGSMLQIDARDFMTKHLQERWLDSGKTAYRMQKVNEPGNSPGRSLTNDIVDFLWKSQSLSMSFLHATTTIAMFSGILWNIGGALNFKVMDYAVSIPGYMVGLAGIFAVAATYAAKKISRELPQIHTTRERQESDYHYAITRIRENSGSIALYNGEKTENKILTQKFDRLIDTLYKVTDKNRKLNLINTAFGKASEVVPLAAAAPRLFAGEITIGGMQQVAGAFTQVNGALTWMVTVAPELAQYQATVGRLQKFTKDIEYHKNRESPIRRVINKTDGPARIVLKDLALERPNNGGSLFEPFSITLQPGDRLALTGVSGSGKSSIIRSEFGIHDEGTGEIEITTKTGILCIPQQPYLPLRSLRGVICYPSGPEDFTNEQILEAMEKAGLSHYVDKLDDDTLEGNYWAQTLSGGEQQRICFARIFLHKPDILMMDEATSSLDPGAEQELYRRVVAELPNTIITSVAHREKVLVFHTIHGHIGDDKKFVQIPLARLR